MFAVRNPNLCSKECLCLYVCPTGATSTEDGTIDAAKCIDGCRLCVDACPEHAIYLVPARFPETPSPSLPLLQKIAAVIQPRAALRTRLAILEEHHRDESWGRIFRALELSSRILAEDCKRASGHLTPHVNTLTSLIEEGVLQNLDPQDEPAATTSTAEEILLRVLDAVSENHDAHRIDLAVCGDCGAIYREPVPDACKRCGSAAMETIS